jgi:hypothetical protein
MSKVNCKKVDRD